MSASVFEERAGGIGRRAAAAAAAAGGGGWPIKAAAGGKEKRNVSRCLHVQSMLGLSVDRSWVFRLLWTLF